MVKSFSLILFSFLIITSVMASESSVYDFSWLDKDKEIYVLQNRKFRKDGQIHFSGNVVKTISGAFIDSYGGTFRTGYFFTEDWGFELVYGKNQGDESDAAKGIREQSAIPFYRKVDNYLGGMLMWSPFYSKINTFNKIFYFDWMFGVGAASITTFDNRNKFDVGSAHEDELTTESAMGLIWNTGFRFYLSENWSLRLDFTGLHYQADKSREIQGNKLKTNQLFSNYDLGLGLNFSF